MKNISFHVSLPSFIQFLILITLHFVLCDSLFEKESVRVVARKDVAVLICVLPLYLFSFLPVSSIKRVRLCCQVSDQTAKDKIAVAPSSLPFCGLCISPLRIISNFFTYMYSLRFLLYVIEFERRPSGCDARNNIAAITYPFAFFLCV